jgi:cytochrome c553
MRPGWLLTLLLALLLPAAAAPANPGRAKAQQACAVCHGELGRSTAPDAPHLAGQPEPYLVAQLRAYRSGARRHEVMNVIAKPLTDAEIQQLAAWFASLRIDVQEP